MNKNIQTSFPHSGSTDEELERLCKIQGRFDSGYAPWVTWESENCGLGKAFRETAFYPKILPLFIASDHGVHWESRCWQNEIDAPAPYYFSWNQKKSMRMSGEHAKKSFHVPHPWLSYRRKKFPSLAADRKGTLVFFPHSNDTTNPVFSNLDKYFADLKALPEKYHPIVICLSFHDVRKGLHQKFRKYSIPLVTVGVSNSQRFVDRFYGLIREFRYATSPTIGSHLFYCVEAGIPFFLYGERPRLQITGSSMVSDGFQNLLEYGDVEDVEAFMRLHELFGKQVDRISDAQNAVVLKYLGADSTISRLEIATIVWNALLISIPHLKQIYLNYCLRVTTRIISKIRSAIVG